MPAKTAQMTGFGANCLAAADHFIACRGSEPATRSRAWFHRNDQAEVFAPTAISAAGCVACACSKGGWRLDLCRLRWVAPSQASTGWRRARVVQGLVP